MKLPIAQVMTIPPSMANHIDNAGADTVGNAVQHFMSQLSQTVPDELEVAPPTQIPATVADQTDHENESANANANVSINPAGTVQPTTIETDELENALVENQYGLIAAELANTPVLGGKTWNFSTNA